MRLWIPVVAVTALAAVSLAARPQGSVEHLLHAINPGEQVILQNKDGGLSVAVVTEDERREMLPTAEERDLYERAQQALHEYRSGERGRDRDAEVFMSSLGEDLNRVREEHGSLTGFVEKLARKMSLKAHTVTAVGEDYFSYREGQREYYIPAHRITSLSRPALKVVEPE